SSVDDGAEVDLAKVQQILLYLSGAFASKNDKGRIGSKWYPNLAPYGWITYGQSAVYNPVDWSMFNQNWRVKLSRATLLDAQWKVKSSSDDSRGSFLGVISGIADEITALLGGLIGQGEGGGNIHTVAQADVRRSLVQKTLGLKSASGEYHLPGGTWTSDECGG